MANHSQLRRGRFRPVLSLCFGHDRSELEEERLDHRLEPFGDALQLVFLNHGTSEILEHGDLER